MLGLIFFIVGISSQPITTVLFVSKIFISCLSETFKHSGLVILCQDIFSPIIYPSVMSR